MSAQPPPLTHADANGKPYVRSDVVSGEIAEALGTDVSTWPSAKLRSETLVHLIRVLCGTGGEESQLGPLVQKLGTHIAQIAKDFAKGFDRTTTEEIVVNVGKDVIALVLSESPTRQSEFLEVNFRVAVKRRTLNEVEKRQHYPRKRELVAVEGKANPLESVADDGPTPEVSAIQSEARDLVKKGLGAVSDPRHREAVMLHHLQGWPITHKDPETPTLCKHFDMTARQIQNWMRTAFAEMRAAVGEYI